VLDARRGVLQFLVGKVHQYGGLVCPASADLYISPEVLRFKRNDFHAADDIAEAGYHASRETLLKWLASAPESVRSLRPDLFAERS